MFQRNPTYQTRAGVAQAELDVGLRAHMLHVFNYMASGLALTGAVAVWFYSSGFFAQVATTPLIWLVMLAPLAFVLVLSFGINRLSVFAAQALYWAYAATMGLSMAAIFAVFTGTSIARVFFITAATFAAVSIWGYTTKRDLSQMGAFMFMGLIGIVIAGVVNIFLGSTMLQMLISVVGVLVFTGLTAWDTQRIKEEYLANFDGTTTSKLAILGALNLYLNFINLFSSLLNLFGERE